MLDIANSHDRKVLAHLVSTTMKRPGSMPRFPRVLEACYEADGRARRVAHLRLSIILGLFIYNLFVFTDSILVPDTGWLGVWVRTGILTPGGLLLLVALHMQFMTCRVREAAVSIAVILFSLGPLVIFRESEAPYADFMLTQVLLTLFFASNVLQLRLPYVAAMSAVNVAATAVVLAERELLPAGLVAVFLAYTACTALFGLICNYAIERSARTAYLLSLQERLRAEGLREDRNQLAILSETDWLTGAANRRSLDHHLDMIWDDPARSASAALILLDIDHFKRLNDFYGHLYGDQCLRLLAAILIDACARPGIFLARYGGEEFAVAVEGMTEAEVTGFAEDLCRSVIAAELPHLGRVDGLSVVTVSLGLARIGDDTVSDRLTLFAAADRALYAAKRIGRNRVVRYGSLEMALAKALSASSGEPASNAPQRSKSVPPSRPTRLAG